MRHAISAVVGGVVFITACSADTAPSSERLFDPSDSGAHTMTISPSSAAIRIGDSVHFAMSPSTGAQVAWSVSDSAVARIDRSGWAFARRTGTAAVIAAANGTRAVASLRVSPATP